MSVRVSALVLAIWIVGLPSLAAACTVCMGGQEEASRQAFVGTTAFMTFLPLTVIAIAVVWFVRHTSSREQDDAERIRRDAISAIRPR